MHFNTLDVSLSLRLCILYSMFLNLKLKYSCATLQNVQFLTACGQKGWPVNVYCSGGQGG